MDDTTKQPLFTPVIDVQRRRGPYCGPTAIALLTGVPISRIEKMIQRKRGRSVTGRKLPVRGTYWWEVTTILRRLGCKVDPLDDKWIAGKTLGTVVTEGLPSTGTYLVNVSGHFMVAAGGKVADTAHPEPISIEDYRRKTRRVGKVWKVVAPAVPRFTVEHEQSLAERAAARKAERAASKPPVQVQRLLEVERQIKAWERKAKLAKTKLTKLYASRKRYERLGVAPTTA